MLCSTLYTSCNIKRKGDTEWKVKVIYSKKKTRLRVVECPTILLLKYVKEYGAIINDWVLDDNKYGHKDKTTSRDCLLFFFVYGPPSTA